MPKSPEGQRGEFFKATLQKWHTFVEGIRLGKKTQIYLPHNQAAVVIDIPAKTLGQLTGGHFGIEILDGYVLFTFSRCLSFTREAYKQASSLMQLSLHGRAEDYWRQLEESRRDLVEHLNEVPGFSDLVDSVISGGTPGQESETIFQHLRLESWYASLLPGEQEGLIRPKDIFTRPG